MSKVEYTLEAMVKDWVFFIVVFFFLCSRVEFFNDNENRFIHVDSELQEIIVQEWRDFSHIMVFCIHEVKYIFKMVEDQ